MTAHLKDGDKTLCGKKVSGCYCTEKGYGHCSCYLCLRAYIERMIGK